MRGIWWLFAALALVAVIACGQSLTVEEYAEECGEILEDLNDADISIGGFDPSDIAYYSSDLDDLDDISDGIDDLKAYIGEYKALSPPSDLQEFHEARVAMLEFAEGEMLAVLEDATSIAEDLFDAYEDGDEDEIEDLLEEIEDLEDDFEDFEDDLEDLVEDLEDAEDDLSSRDRRDLEREDCL